MGKIDIFTGILLFVLNLIAFLSSVEAFEATNGTSRFGEDCRNASCVNNLICLNDVCTCDETESIYDSEYLRCSAKVGASCKKYGSCVRNADCSYSHPRYQISLNRDVVICKCIAGHREVNGLCVGEHGSHCDPVLSPCTEEYTCIGGKCSCHFPDFHEYNPTLRKCVAKINGPCKEYVSGKIYEYSCSTPHTECRMDNGISQCLCNRGFIESEAGQCRYAHGSSCFVNEHCDSVANLLCVNGTCACPPLQEYDATEDKCKGLIGSKCFKDEFCVDGAMCKFNRDKTLGAEGGVCLCMPGRKANRDRKCLVDLDKNVSIK